MAERVQEVTGESIELAFVDQGYTGEVAAEATAPRGRRLEVVMLPETLAGLYFWPSRS